MISNEQRTKVSRDALDLAAALHEMTSAAAEVIFRRSQLMISGKISAIEVVAMMIEKATVFGDASKLAAVVAARGGDPFSIARAALRAVRPKDARKCGALGRAVFGPARLTCRWRGGGSP